MPTEEPILHAGESVPAKAPAFGAQESAQPADPILNMDKEALVKHMLCIFSLTEVERVQAIALAQIRAQELGIEGVINQMVARYDKEDKALKADYRRELAKREGVIDLQRDKNGVPCATIPNFLAIMQNDLFYAGVRFNLLSNRPEIQEENAARPFTDADMAQSRAYIEGKYKIHNEQKHRDALRLLFKAREYHPIRDIVDNLVWDKVERIERFLTTWAKCDDTPYTREVSRLIFAGGIHRLYTPGCKFDDVPVLIGTAQGEGKSTLVRWLAIHDSYFGEVTEIEGQRAIEQLEGAWICEVAELLALTRVKEQEAVKAYITRQRDKYRRPYDTQVEEYPRRCVFIGTTNNEQFLKDKTGNRRFYPVRVHSSGYWLYEHEEECRSYILQCWAEAREKCLQGAMPNFADPKFKREYQQAQEDAMEDDWRVGAIQGYLEQKAPGDRVCIRQIMHEALSPSPDFPRDPTKSESNEIAQMMCRMEGWVRLKNPCRLGKYGLQRCWEKQSPLSNDQNNLPFAL